MNSILNRVVDLIDEIESELPRESILSARMIGLKNKALLLRKDIKNQIEGVTQGVKPPQESSSIKIIV